MAFKLADRVLETTLVIGTGAATLLGAETSYVTFDSFLSATDTTSYTIEHDTADEWEVGIGTYSAGTLTRTTVLASSNGGSAVSFTSGTKRVFCSRPALGALYPPANDGGALGVSGTAWSDLFLAAGGVINWNAGNVTLAHTSNSLIASGCTTFLQSTSGASADFLTERTDTHGSNVACGRFQAYGRDSAGNSQLYAQFNGFCSNATNGAEAGEMRFGVAVAGSLTNTMILTGTALTPFSSDGTALGTTSSMWSDLFLASGGTINWDAGDVVLTHASNNLTVSGGTSFVVEASAAVASNIVRRTGIHGAASVGTFNFQGSDSAGNVETYGQLTCFCTDDTSGNEDSTYLVNVMLAGTLTTLYQFTGTALRPNANDAVALGSSTASWSDLFLASGGVINFNNGNLTMTHSAGALAITGVTTVASATATPAAGSTSARLLFGTTAGFGIYYGSGAPTVSAAQGSIYLRSDGSSTATRLYVNTNGSTGWTNFTSAT
jgi:hypothetical protein